MTETKAALDPAFFLAVHDQFEQARREIEQRFLGAGDVLVEVREHIQVLIQALDRIAGAFDEKRTDRTIGTMQDAISDLQGRVGSETARGDKLSAMAHKLTEIQKEISKIHAVLRYLAACAVSTRVAAAGNDKFMSFAEEIARYVQSAEHEVAGFLRKVTQMESELARMGEEHQNVVAVVGSAVGAAAPQLMEAAQTIDRRRVELERLAARAAPVMHAAGRKFTDTLSALQIGDMTRQRIEHVQEIIQALLERMRTEPDSAGLCVPALHLFDVLTASLSADFDKDARNVVGTLQGVASDARNIHTLVQNFATQAESRADPTKPSVKDRFGSMRELVVEIEEAGQRSASVDATIRRLARELLDNRSDIGNLRNVQGDIRLLAINAYLHCSRMGDLGRTIGAIATEINLEGEKLGRSATAVLRTLAELGAGGEDPDGANADRDLVADLDEVGGALQDMDADSGESVQLIAAKGEAIARRIETVAQDLDFSGRLGEQLVACSTALRQALAGAGPVQTPVRPEALTTFSDEAYARYTMDSERELHLTVFPDMRARVQIGDQGARPTSASEDEVEDFFL
ncbi:putative coiled-coil protein SlyX [Rhodoblastus sphagnicola]|nr:hypothetical protein [Rhodoblastus sphagnicola]MBB4199739.1 putative coiled-coil protein SlyX [Rhodoblastus sphagnicola]